MSWPVATFIQSSAELLSAARTHRDAGSIVEAGRYAYAAVMHAHTRGSDETVHGKLLHPKYKLLEFQNDLAMRLYMDGIKADADALHEFSEWFNDEILARHEYDEHAGRNFASVELADAVRKRDKQRVQRMLSYGTDPNALGGDGMLVLEGPSARGHVEIVALLIKHGARAMQGNAHGSTPMHGAAYYGEAPALHLLLQSLPSGVSPDVADENGNTPLIAAAATSSPAKKPDRIKCVKMLLDAGADPKAALNTGSHESVLPLLSDAAGAGASPKTIAEAVAYQKQQDIEIEERWASAFDAAVDAGALSEAEYDRLTDKLAEGHERGRSREMQNMLQALEACRLGDMLRKDTRVCLEGLRAKPELNGRCGRVLSFQPSNGRYAIALDATTSRGTSLASTSASPITVKRRNLKRAEIPEYEEMPAEALASSWRSTNATPSTEQSTRRNGREVPPPVAQPTADAREATERAAPAVGCLARISGLTARPRLNGAYCEVDSYDATRGRFVCKIKGSGEWVLLKAESLEQVARTDADGVALGAASCQPAFANLMNDDLMEAISPDAHSKAKAAAAARSRSTPSSTDGPPLLDAQLEPVELYRTAIRYTEEGRDEDACWLFLLALLVDWALNGSDLTAPQRAIDNAAADSPCAIALQGVVSTFSAPQESYEQARKPLAFALAELTQAYGTLGPQEPPPNTLEEQHRGRLALTAAHLFLSRLEQISGPYTPANWNRARRRIQKGIQHVDAQRFLCLQYELAYTARDAAADEEALKWYDTMLRNGKRLATPSTHWTRFLERVDREAQQVRWQKESGLGKGGMEDCKQQ